MPEDDDLDAAVGAGLIDRALSARIEAFSAKRRSRALGAVVDAHLPEASRGLRPPRSS